MKTLPGDGDTVYLHRLGDSMYAVATFDLASMTFTTTSGIALPAYIVIDWTPYP